MTLEARLDILPAAQRELWPYLAAVPRQYILYGGTALALRLGHRVSIDFDLFASAPLDHGELEALDLLRGATTIQHGPSERTFLVDRGHGSVKISFFGSLPFGRVGEPNDTSDRVLRVASLLDLAGTKIKALLQRVESKDYKDVAALIAHGVALAQICAAGRALFGPAFNPLVAQKALAYFEGSDLDSLDESTRALLVRESIADLDLPSLPVLSSRLDA
ncbi:MAG: nucleotidyl transferase AbiEii/AbiGii toxin family protein [Myxococcota bacterium]|nr:nucleotidyl transferase AbiEii/AbiGii toxin family protein [Deltaproteobacteria bacterium]MDQ3337403.1 nucleotidyl transferase AbiEii/AbiGii toxin family protein [Myxococcota bacterium]